MPYGNRGASAVWGCVGCSFALLGGVLLFFAEKRGSGVEQVSPLTLGGWLCEVARPVAATECERLGHCGTSSVHCVPYTGKAGRVLRGGLPPGVRVFGMVLMCGRGARALRRCGDHPGGAHVVGGKEG
jgi:hypothetical protein